MKLIIMPWIPKPPAISHVVCYNRLEEFREQDLRAFTNYLLTWYGEEIKLTTRIYMPKWNYHHRTSREIIKEWERFYAALLFHEEGHVQICRDHSRHIVRVMAAARPEIRAALFEAEQKILEARHAEYDRRTDHGKLQVTPYGPIILSNPGDLHHDSGKEK